MTMTVVMMCFGMIGKKKENKKEKKQGKMFHGFN
jgi:hypothetical protein